MKNTTEKFDIDDVEIRIAEERDFPVIYALYEESVIEGQLRENDTGADIDNLQDAYFSDDGDSAFWVATHGNDVIGMIGVQQISPDQAEVRRLRVAEPYRRRGVGSKLMRQAIAFCRDRGYLKVTLDVRIDREPAIAMFDKLGFQLARTREVDGRKMLDFYLDLYREPEE